MKWLKLSLRAGVTLCTLAVLLMSSGIANAASWTIVPSANKANFTVNELKAVATVSPTNVWAVGSFYNSNSGTSQTLTEQWNGRSWKVVSSPLAPSSSDNVLMGLKVISQNDIWAVGYSKDMNQTLSRTLTEHWNGTRWSVVPSPNKGTANNQLLSVSSVSASDIWAVGFYVASSGGVSVAKTLTEHWNGRNWSVVGSPNASSSINQLKGVIALSSTNVWAVGYSIANDNPRQTLIEHWTGSSWSIVSSPNTGTGDNVLNAVTKVAGTSQAWAVGYSSPIRFGANQFTLIERYG